MVDIIAKDLEFINRLIRNSSITGKDLPSEAWIGLDSMGPCRDPESDRLFDGIAEIINQFTGWMKDYKLGLLVATNGPDKEGVEILESIADRGTKAFAVTEGGGKLIYFRDDSIAKITLATNLLALDRLEGIVERDSFIRAMLRDTNARGGQIPMRTEYDTNIVITLPKDLLEFQSRIDTQLLYNLHDLDESNYVTRILGYLDSVFKDVIRTFDMSDEIGEPIIKPSNRRIYVPAKSIGSADLDPINLSKSNGALMGSTLLNRKQNWPIYEIDSSIYVADRITDNGTLTPGEICMVKNGKPTSLAINITMSDRDPTFEVVDGVKVINLSSGISGLYAIMLLYTKLSQN